MSDISIFLKVWEICKYDKYASIENVLLGPCEHNRYVNKPKTVYLNLQKTVRFYHLPFWSYRWLSPMKTCE